jgi:tetratricopeptide (TPR) repeat protein
MESVYELYQRGCALLEHGDHQAAIVPLTHARNLEPAKASIREALGRALFHAQAYERAAEEFGAVASIAPTNDYALFCLGRAMQLLGRHREACHPLAVACSLRPEREDYRRYRDRARRHASERRGAEPERRGVSERCDAAEQ